MSTAKKLADRLREHIYGPVKCPTCGNTHDDFKMAETDGENGCRQEGQCDWNMHYGLHSSHVDDIHQFKLDVAHTIDYLNRIGRRFDP